MFVDDVYFACQVVTLLFVQMKASIVFVFTRATVTSPMRGLTFSGNSALESLISPLLSCIFP